ncbi:hypothetical protein INT45_010176 [Circinella minor]|uniref:Uncharacterized protein n=1 Tax=Circinella minor TaxID=1195481 RepID=A0A8H7VPU1_9FUNG|nr:hypothetical protein INT45_010176 [Circinella minor]
MNRRDKIHKEDYQLRLTRHMNNLRLQFGLPAIYNEPGLYHTAHTSGSQYRFMAQRQGTAHDIISVQTQVKRNKYESLILQHFPQQLQRNQQTDFDKFSKLCQWSIDNAFDEEERENLTAKTREIILSIHKKLEITENEGDAEQRVMATNWLAKWKPRRTYNYKPDWHYNHQSGGASSSSTPQQANSLGSKRSHDQMKEGEGEGEEREEDSSGESSWESKEEGRERKALHKSYRQDKLADSWKVEDLNMTNICSKYRQDAIKGAKQRKQLSHGRVLNRKHPKKGEPGFIIETIKPFLKHLVNNNVDVLTDWMTYHLKPSGQQSEQITLIPDFVVSSTKSKVQVPGFKDTKVPHNLHSDLVKLGKEMKIGVEKLVNEGVEEPEVVGIVVEGVEMTTYKLDLKYDGQYRMYVLNSCYLSRKMIMTFP